MDVIYISRSIGKIKHRFVYILKPGREIGQSFEESLRGGKQKLFEGIIKRLLNLSQSHMM